MRASGSWLAVAVTISSSPQKKQFSPWISRADADLGQVIRRWDMDGWNPGCHQVTWDGRDARGRPMASGVYLVELEAGERVSTQKLMLLQ